MLTTPGVEGRVEPPPDGFFSVEEDDDDDVLLLEAIVTTRTRASGLGFFEKKWRKWNEECRTVSNESYQSE